jgi:hypothetical protein
MSRGSWLIAIALVLGCGTPAADNTAREEQKLPQAPSASDAAPRAPHVTFWITKDRPTLWTADWHELGPLLQVHLEWWVYYYTFPYNLPSAPEWRAEAKKILPTYQKAWDGRGTDLLNKAVSAGGIAFPYADMPPEMKEGPDKLRIALYLSAGVTGAYDMKSYPFYPYLSSYPVQANLLGRQWTTDDFVEFYMLHEILHWYLLHQPWLKRWTPTLDRLYRQYKDDPRYSDIMSGASLTTAGKPQVPGGDPYPALPFNMYNFLGHIHVFALMRTAYADEPATWKSVIARTKAFTGAVGDRYYGLSIDTVDAMSPADLGAVVAEVKASVD